MKVTITASGSLEISAENSLEEYALSKFQKDSVVYQRDEKRNEEFHWRGNSIKILEEWSHCSTCINKESCEQHGCLK